MTKQSMTHSRNKLFVTMKVLDGLDTSETLAVLRNTFHCGDLITSIISCHCPKADVETTSAAVPRREEELDLESIHIMTMRRSPLFATH